MSPGADEKYDEPYLRSVTRLGDRREVVSTRAIYTSKNIKLLEGGVRINSALFEKLLLHKLLPPLDKCVTVEGAVTTASLVDCAQQSLAERKELAPIAAVFGSDREAAGVLSAIHLEPPLAFKLTLAREMRPKLFEHSIDVCLLAAYLARKSGASDEELRSAVEAGLFHDIGELHIDPDLLDSTRALTEGERRHIYSHPLTAFLILQEYKAFAPEVAAAVLEHHERLDGSGYPRGTRREEISPLGRNLMLSEVCASLLRKGAGPQANAQVGMMLRLSRRKFEPALLDHIAALLGSELPRTAEATPDVATVAGAFERIAEILRDWERVQVPRSGKGAAPDSLVQFVNGRVVALAQTLVESGFDYRKPEAFAVPLAADPQLLAEMGILSGEALWQLQDVLREVERQWKEFGDSTPSTLVAVQGWLMRSADRLGPS